MKNLFVFLKRNILPYITGMPENFFCTRDENWKKGTIVNAKKVFTCIVIFCGVLFTLSAYTFDRIL